jgi:hypothetical protein
VTSSFQVYGPFEFDKKKVQNKDYRKAKWDECDSKHAGLAQAKGLYLYSLKNKQNFVPQYVGITNKQGFEREVFRDGNLLKISNLLQGEKGSLQIHLIAKPKATHSGFSNQIKADTLRWLERLILFSCLTKNPDMLNKSHRVFLKSVEIERVTGEESRGKKPRSVKTFMSSLGY